MEKTQSGTLVFSDEEVKKIFVLRSKNVRLQNIAKQMNCSTWTIGQVLKRKRHGDVVIPDNILTAVEAISRAGKGRYIRKKAVKGTNGHNVNRAEALAAYCDAVLTMHEARVACLKRGLTEDSLRLLADSLREN